MAACTNLSAEQVANRFVRYLAIGYSDRRHVIRVAHWLGFLIKAIDRASEGSFWISSTRQIKFEYRGHKFKARYRHKIGNRGGIEIVESLQLKGSPDSDPAVQILNLDQAADVFDTLEHRLDKYIEC
jgi:hypothetical protein